MRTRSTFMVCPPPQTHTISISSSQCLSFVLGQVLAFVVPVVLFLALPTLEVILPPMTTTGLAFGWMVLHVDDAFDHSKSVCIPFIVRTLCWCFWFKRQLRIRQWWSQDETFWCRFELLEFHSYCAAGACHSSSCFESFGQGTAMHSVHKKRLIVNYGAF